MIGKVLELGKTCAGLWMLGRIWYDGVNEATWERPAKGDQLEDGTRWFKPTSFDFIYVSSIAERWADR